MKNDLVQAVGRFSGSRVLIVGDLILDHYVMGSVDRISPEAPVPVVRVDQENSVLGGAGNVARNVADLGGDPILIGMIGNDDDGAAIASYCKRDGLTLIPLVDASRPTTKKTRIIANNQQVVRVDHEVGQGLDGTQTAWVCEQLQKELDRSDVVIISDYGKGFITGAVMECLADLLTKMDTPPMVLVDPKTVNYDFYAGVSMLTPNTKEAGEGAGMSVSSQEDVIKAGKRLFDRLKCDHLLVTMGAQGMALFQARDSVLHIPTLARKVYDVTGAGDTVIATLGLALASGADLLMASMLANYAAGLTVAQVGAATTNPVDLVGAINDLPLPEVNEITD